MQKKTLIGIVAGASAVGAVTAIIVHHLLKKKREMEELKEWEEFMEELDDTDPNDFVEVARTFVTVPMGEAEDYKEASEETTEEVTEETVEGDKETVYPGCFNPDDYAHLNKLNKTEAKDLRKKLKDMTGKMFIVKDENVRKMLYNVVAACEAGEIPEEKIVQWCLENLEEVAETIKMKTDTVEVVESAEGAANTDTE